MFIFLKVCMMVVMDILKVSWSKFMEGMWVVALALAVIIIIGATFQPLARILLRSEPYLACLEATYHERICHCNR
jgi:hypothetical protein